MKAEFGEEIERIKRQYEAYDKMDFRNTVWSPFQINVAAYTSQQLLTFSHFMRKIDWSDLSNRKILDVGCGTGRILRSFLDQRASASNLFGVDINTEWLSKAREISPNIDFRVGDGSHLDFPDHFFDLVTQYVVFSSIAMPELRQQLAGEMWRVVKPGGYIFWWDTLKLSAYADAAQSPLNVKDLFPGVPISTMQVGPKPKPSECLRYVPGVRRILAPIVDAFGFPSTHVAALLGPKPEAASEKLPSERAA